MGDRFLETIFYLVFCALVVFVGFFLFSFGYVFLFRLYLVGFLAMGAVFLTGFIILELVGSKAQYEAIRTSVHRELLRSRPKRRSEL